MTGLRRTAICVAVAALIAGLAPSITRGATPGFTVVERALATELARQLTEDRSIKAPKSIALAYARVYMKRAYRLDVEPAKAIAKHLLPLGRRFKDSENRQRLQHFAWSIDAVLRGADLKEVLATLTFAAESTFSKADKELFVEQVLANASRYASPLAIVKIIDLANDNGLVGKRRRDLLSWVIAQVRRGENPEYIRQIHVSIAEATPNFRQQQEFLDKCYRAVRRGVAASALAKAVAQMQERQQTTRRINETLDRVLALYGAGRPFDEAVRTVMPPKKEEEEE